MKKIFLLIVVFSALQCNNLSDKNKVTDKKNNENPSPEARSPTDKSMDDFNNRPIHNELTEQIIDNTADDELLQIISDNLASKQPKHHNKEYETVMAWNKARQAIWEIWLLETEVNNGGYNQFYYNSSGQFYKLLPEALKLVGANKFADLTTRANQIFEKENPKITQHQDGTLEGFSKSYDDNPLNKFDDEFYALYKIENLQQIQIEYIRKHKNDFIDK